MKLIGRDNYSGGTYRVLFLVKQSKNSFTSSSWATGSRSLNVDRGVLKRPRELVLGDGAAQI